jgi:hypothetical protein
MVRVLFAVMLLLTSLAEPVLAHGVHVGGRGELVRPQVDGLLDCAVGRVKDQCPDPVGLGAIIVRVRQGNRQDFPLAIERLVQQPCQFFAGRHGTGRSSGRICGYGDSRPLLSVVRVFETEGGGI